MVDFSASDVALTGFRILRERPMLLLWWALPHLVFFLVTTVLMVTVAGPHFMELRALQAQGQATTPETQAQVLSAIGAILPLYLVMFPLMLALYALMLSAVNRAVLRPADSAYGYLRIGMDELRQGLLFLWAIALGLAAEIAIGIAITIITIVLTVITAASVKSGSGLLAGLGGFAVLAGALIFFAAYVYVLVRLSLSSAMTFDTGRVQFLKSWRLTKGRFWPLFGTYILALIFDIILMVLGAVLVAIVGMLTGGGLSVFSAHPDMSSLAAYFDIGRIVYLVVFAALYALMLPIMVGPPAAIYKALMATPGEIPAPATAPAR